MHDVMLALQFAAFIPIAVYVIYKPTLNTFFKLLLASIFLSIVTDVVAYIFGYLYRNNIVVICIYSILNASLVTFMWQKVPIYSEKVKRLVRQLGFGFILVMLITVVYFKSTIYSLYLLSSFNVLLGLVFALQYYYQKITFASYSPLSGDPYFITATAYILLCLSTIIITAAQIYFDGKADLTFTWVIRQVFYLMYNIIIGYAFYILQKSQLLKE